MSIYSPFLAGTTQVLISKILLSVPELITEIAPDGLEHSKFSFIKPVTDKQAYQQYRISRVERYKINNYEFKHGWISQLPMPEPFKTFEAYCLHYKRLPEDMPIEMIRILIKCIQHIFGYECVVYNKHLKSHTLGRSYGGIWLFIRFLEELHIMDPRILKYQDLYWKEESTDLVPIYEFIFKKLKVFGLDWDYRNYDLSFLHYDENNRAKERENEKIYQENYDTFKAAIETQANLEGREVIEADWKPYYEGVVVEEPPAYLDRWGTLVCSGERDLCHPCNDYGDCISLQARNKVCKTFEVELLRLQQLVQPESGKLKAYFKVYGKWPKGYPEKREDYGYFSDN